MAADIYNSIGFHNRSFRNVVVSAVKPQHLLTILAVTAAICGTALLAYIGLHDPCSSPAPKCFFHTLTGLQCPGCGSQRAIHALLHGRIADAWHFNAALFFALPLAALYIAGPKRMRPFLYSRPTLITMILTIIIWWIARNL